MDALNSVAQNAVCAACGTQFGAEQSKPPAQCPICHDVRQAMPRTGQASTTLERLRITHFPDDPQQLGVTGT